MRDFIKFLIEWFKDLFGNKETIVEFSQPLKTEDVKILGRNAKEALENPAILTAIRRIEENYFSIWKNSKPLEKDGRESVWFALQALESIKLKLTGMVNEMIIEQDKSQQKGVKK